VELTDVIEQTEFDPVSDAAGGEGWTAFLDRELRIVSTSDGCRTLFGWEPGQIRGRRLGDLINLAPLTSLVVAGFCFRAEPAATHGRNLLCSYVPIVEDGKSLGGFLSIAERAGEEVAPPTNLAQALGPLMDIVQDGLVVIDREGVITLVNQHFADALGARAQDMIGKHIHKAYTSSRTARLPIVMETGKAEIGWPHLINGREVVACR